MNIQPKGDFASQAGASLPPGRLHGKPLVLFLTLLAALGMLATNMYLASFLSLGRELVASPAEIQLTLTVFLASFAFGQLVIGPLSDRYGRRPLLVAGLTVYAVASALCAVAADLESMLAFRALQAVGACTGTVLARAVARDLFHGDELTRSLGFITTFVAAAPGFSPLIGGFIESFFGWRYTFALLALVGVFAVIVVWRAIPETNRIRAANFSLVGSFATYFAILGDRRFAVPVSAAALAMAGLFAFFASSPTIFIDEFGVPPALFGFIPCGTVFAVFAGGLSGPRLAKRWPGMRAIAGGFLLMIAGSVAMLAFALSGQTGIWQVLATLVVFLFGLGVVNPLATVAALRPFPERAGAASALIGFFQMAGGALGVVVLGLLPLPILAAFPAVMSVSAALGLLALAAGRSRV
jgi:DHA1 family bicyclomycin/chloramphenicol resistance-like MFS transporter